MKVGDAHNSNRKAVSYNTQDLIEEQLDNLTSMVYNMFIQKEGYNRPFKPQIHQKRRGQNWKSSEIETEIDHPVGIEQTTDETMTNALGQAIGDNHRKNETIGEEIIDTKIMEPEVKTEIGVEIE